MNHGLHVAGVGASAGGLEAMLPLFARMPRTGHVTYIVAQHMAHNGHSELLARLIGRESALPVVLATDGTPLRADTVYLVPSGSDGLVRGDRLSLRTPAAGQISTPSVNALLASIADTCGGKAIGIVLSGAGSDGVAGCRAVKAQGGLTIVQDPRESKFDGMPQAVIDAGLGDVVLPVEAIGARLAAMFPGVAPVASPKFAPAAAVPSDSGEGLSATDLEELGQVLKLVHQATGIDFSSYKEETLVRRLKKRKSTLGVATAEAYLALLRRDPGELRALQRLFLVSVSSFFRDRDSFFALGRAMAGSISDLPPGMPIRVWVPGCASGEEPYTLAIVLAELLDDDRVQHPVEIVGTDLNAEALDVARKGVYRLTALAEAEADLRDRYFTARGQHFAIRPEIASCVRFEQGDVLAGSPPGEFELVSCRNLLIYMKSQLQDRLVASFHQVLRPKGLLLLGSSESLGVPGQQLFMPIDPFNRLFRRRH